MNIFSKFLFIFLLLLNFKSYSNSIEMYIPSLSDLNGEHLYQIKQLSKSVKQIKNQSTKMRGSGADIYSSLISSTVLINSSYGFGSGVLISADGFIITNYHVIETNNSYNKNLTVQFCPIDYEKNITNQKSYIAKTIKVDPERDLALIKLNTKPDILINKPAKLKFSKNNTRIGMNVHAIGHPNGNHCYYTTGVVSQIKKDHTWTIDGEKYKATVIQTQTPINPGNSGGPLINDNAEVIGIATFGYLKSQGLNYAVASNEIEDFVLNAPLITDQPKKNETNNAWITKKNENKWITKKNWSNLNCADQHKEAIDTNDNKINDMFSFDVDCDDMIDLYKIDVNEDGLIDMIVVDKNHNGIYELIIVFDTHKEGEYKNKDFAIYHYDNNEDEIEDQMCLDVDFNQEIDYCKDLS